MTFSNRLKDALLASGLDPTPENLARLADMVLEDAQKWLAAMEAFEQHKALCRVAQLTGFRMTWLVTGEGPPYSHFRMPRTEQQFIALLQSLSDSGIRKLLRTAKHLQA